jgi:lysine/ornithine N-monooxygenase
LSSHPDFSLHLNTRVLQAERSSGGSGGWDVRLKSQDKEETQHFEHLVVATGYFGEPIIPEGIAASPPAAVPVVHSCNYRDLKTLFGGRASAKGKILIVGGQMSGVEIAGTIASHLSSAMNSPDDFSIPDIDQCSIHHIVQRPIWVFPLYTTAEVSTWHKVNLRGWN